MDLVTPGIGLVFWTTVTFLLVVFLLIKFAWKPVLGMINERNKSIEDALQLAEKTKAEMAQLQADNERIIAEARKERDNLLKEAREMKDQMIAQAKKVSPDTVFVILSGYADFSYAQTAMRLGVQEYLLKPATISDVRSLLERLDSKEEVSHFTWEEIDGGFKTSGDVKMTFKDEGEGIKANIIGVDLYFEKQ